MASAEKFLHEDIKIIGITETINKFKYIKF